MDRHRCIVVPPYRSSISTMKAHIISAGIWSAAIVLFVPFAIWFTEQRSLDGKKIACTLVFPKTAHFNISLCFAVPVLLLASVIPMILLVYHYHMIFRKIISTKNTWAASCVVVSSVNMKGCNRSQSRRESEVSLSDIFVPWPRKFSSCSSQNAVNGRHGSWSHHEELRINKHIKVVRVLFLNVVVVLVMWLPITIVMLLIFIDGRRPQDDKNYFLKSEHFTAALIVAYLNTLVNPLLYGVFSESFKVCLRNICCFKSDDEKTRFLKDNVTPTSARLRETIPKKKSFVISLSENQINV